MGARSKTGLCISLLLVFGNLAHTQGEAPEAKLGVLLDTSAEMGFLVPQARKEVRILNARLTNSGHPPIAFIEMEGASIGKEASLSVPGSKNALYPIKKLFEEESVDTVYWITSLQGLQSGAGLSTLEQILTEAPEGRPARKLVIRHIWQEQVQAGDSWIRYPPTSDEDRLDPEARPGEWYRLVENDRGIIIRSWQVPLADYRAQFGFPWRARHSGFLRKAGYSEPVEFDFSWANSLAQRHQLHFLGPKEEWPSRITGRSWIFDHSLVPYPADDTEWNEEVFAALSIRDSIEEDLGRINASKVGIVSAFGFVQSDLERYRRGEERARRHPSFLYISDLSRAVEQARENQRSWDERGEAEGRCYATEFFAVGRSRQNPEETDPIALRIAQVGREQEVDAIYLFTNGFVGGGAYGTFTMNLDHLERAVKASGVRLYVRMPFETGPAPVTLQRLALASGGEVFQGKQGDPDWDRNPLSGGWPSDSSGEN